MNDIENLCNELQSPFSFIEKGSLYEFLSDVDKLTTCTFINNDNQIKHEIVFLKKDITKNYVMKVDNKGLFIDNSLNDICKKDAIICSDLHIKDAMKVAKEYREYIRNLSDK